ncbi:type I restriction/modification system N-6 DNA methyltransferase [Helicobacter pametensis]|nr:type I restriction/modification system N-6 DNA methyltransferase [Helicobacter pametensis]
MTIVGNSIGDIGIVKFNLDICNLTENAVRLITKKNKIKPEYLFSFLESKFGQNYIERNKVGTAQPKLSIERIRKIKIPIISLEVQDEIEAIVSSAFEKLQKSKEIYQTAQNLLLEHLGLKDFNPPSQTVNIKSFTDSFGTSGRLDAEFYQEKYESYLKKIQAFNNGFVQIQQEYSQVKSKSKFDLPAYQYIEIGDVNVSDGSYSFNEVAIEDLPANAKIMVKEGDILISTVRPNRGAITVIEHDRDDLIVSGAFTVLRRKVKSYFNNEFLKVLLRTEIYKDWLLQFNVGTSYPVIKDEDILNLVIPNVEETIQTQIADLIRQSDRLRQESQALLEEAKRKVEQAIEG